MRRPSPAEDRDCWRACVDGAIAAVIVRLPIVGPAAALCAVCLITMFYRPCIGTKLTGLVGVLKAVTGIGAASSSSGSSKAKAC
jgi:hypothetical protein